MRLGFLKTAKILVCCLMVLPFAGTLTTSAPQFRRGPQLQSDAARRSRLEELLREGRLLVQYGHAAEAERHFLLLWKSATEAKEYGLAARGIGNAGACQFALHRYREATRSFLEGYRLAGIAGDRSGAAIFEANLASLYSEMGELDAAVEWTEHGLRSITGKDRDEHLAELLIQLGSLRARQGRLPESSDLFLQGIDIADRQRKPGLYAVGWNRFGEELMRQGERVRGEQAFLEAFRVRSIRHLPLSGSLTNLGKALMGSGDFEGAASLLDYALESSRQSQSVPALDAYRARGIVRLRAGRLRPALEDLRIAVRLERAWRGSTPGSDAVHIGAEGVLAEVHGALIEAGNRLYLREGGDDLIRETFEAAEENRANSLRVLISSRRARDEDFPPSFWAALARLQRAEVAVLRQSDAATEAEARSARADVVRLEAEHSPDGPSPATGLLDRVQSTLDSDGALLSFHMGESISWLWAIDVSGLTLYPLPARRQIEAQVQAAARAIREDAPDSRVAGASLYRTLFGSLDPRFQRKARWLLALDMGLFDAPFAALCDAKEGPAVYAADRHIIQVIPGAGAWIESLHGQTERPSSLFVGVGDPIYNSADPRLPQQAGGIWSRWFRSAATAPPVISLPRLVASGAEIEACARSWNGEYILLRGGAVSRQKLAEQLARNPAAVHFATHFLASSDRSSAIIPLGLGGGNGAEVLSAAEISHWRTQAAVVVLSGCHSAAGATLRGSGLLGLTRAWLTAGARSVVASRWPTADDDGALFQAFYSDLHANDNHGAAEALRVAQIKMLRSGGWRARPSYWGAYFVVGNE